MTTCVFETWREKTLTPGSQVMTTTPKLHEIDCARSCTMDPLCVSLEYNDNTKLCTLFKQSQTNDMPQSATTRIIRLG